MRALLLAALLLTGCAADSPVKRCAIAPLGTTDSGMTIVLMQCQDHK